jgi:hypothetical protein
VDDACSEPGASLLFFGDLTAEEREIGKRIEDFRGEMRRATMGDVESFSSPRSRTFATDSTGHALPGPRTPSPQFVHAETGVDMKGGLLLRRLVEGLEARRVLELGTNTGLSGCYFLSAPGLEELVTIEGSAGLCEIADSNLRRISDRYTILNKLFDAAIDDLMARGATFDCVYVDGQHEREATWHYTRRLLPLVSERGALVYDDIYWSDDMNQFWKEVCVSGEFSLTVDLQLKGIAIPRRGVEPKVQHDICDYLGRPRIHRKEW